MTTDVTSRSTALADGFGQVSKETLAALAVARATLPLQLRTAYAVGGLAGCETVISVTNLSDTQIEVQIEFFTGFGAMERGIASLILPSGATGEIATAPAIPPYVINAVRDDNLAFEGYANIHAATRQIGAQVNMVCGIGGDIQTYEDINVFRPPFQQGD